MKKMTKFLARLFKRPTKKQHARSSGERLERDELLLKTAEGSAQAVKQYGKAIEKLAKYDRI